MTIMFIIFCDAGFAKREDGGGIGSRADTLKLARVIVVVLSIAICSQGNHWIADLLAGLWNIIVINVLSPREGCKGKSEERDQILSMHDDCYDCYGRN